MKNFLKNYPLQSTSKTMAAMPPSQHIAPTNTLNLLQQKTSAGTTNLFTNVDKHSILKTNRTNHHKS